MTDLLLHASYDIAPWTLICLGGFVGVLSGLLGVGGGVLMTPALHILGLPMPVAVATTLTQMVASSLSGTIKHHSQANVSIPLTLVFGVPGILGVLLGKELMVFVSNDPQFFTNFSLVYACFLIFMTFSMLQRMLKKGQRKPSKIWTFGPSRDSSDGLYKIYYLPSMFFGSFVGVISGLTGLGGGFFYMPIMSQVMGVPLKVAVGSSLGIVLLSSLVGATTYGLAGMSELGIAAVIAVGSIVGSYMGASATKYVKGAFLKMLFAMLVFVAAVSVFLKYFGQQEASFYLLISASLLLLGLALFNAASNFRKERQNS